MYIGEYLKKKRKNLGISVIKVAKELNISIYYIEAIESDDYSRTPGGVYTIGFIRNYANYLNLDSNRILLEYKKQISLSDSSQEIIIPKPLEAFNPLQYNKFLSLVAIVSISAIFYFLFINDDTLKSNYALTPELPVELETEIEEYDVKSALLKVKEEKIEKKFEQQIVKEEIIDQINNNQLAAIASKPDESLNNNLSNLISIRALKPTWIQLRDKNNLIIISKLLSANETYNYSINSHYYITTGNAGNLIVSIGGEVVGKLGDKGEVLNSIVISQNYFSN